MLILSSGCTTSTPDLEIAGLLHDDASATNLSERQAQEFDFGPVLATGRTLRHEFSLSNPTDRPIRLLKAVTSTPCCSAIGPLAKSIPPGGGVQVPIILKTEGKAGHLRVDFAVETDSPTDPIRRLAVAVRLVREWEVQTEGEYAESLPLGQAGKLSYRIFCRRIGVEGRGLPERIIVSGPVKAVFGESADDVNGPEGMIEASRKVEVELEASTQAGRRQGQIVFQWVDGRTQNHIVTWEVRPRVKVTPAGLVIKPSKEPVAVVLTVASDDRPIRIVKVDGPLAKPFASLEGARKIHPLSLSVDARRAARDGIADIKITTDHPQQPNITVAVLITSSKEGDDR